MGPPAARQMLAHALEHIPAATFLISARGRVVLANRLGMTWLAGSRARAAWLAAPGGPDPARFDVTAAGGHYLAVLRSAAGASSRAVERAAHWGLSARERDVFSRVIAGLSNKQIAAAMRIAEVTVENHVTRIFRKAGVESRSELLARLLRDTEGFP